MTVEPGDVFLICISALALVLNLMAGVMSIRPYRAAAPGTAQRSNARLGLILTFTAAACFLLVLVTSVIRTTL